MRSETGGERGRGGVRGRVEGRGGGGGGWNDVLHALQQPFKAASAHDERKKH